MAERLAIPFPALAPVRLTGRGDSRLARAAADGDQRAFELIYERYHQELYRYCQAILGDPHDAQDALQSTMASALRALPGEARSIELRPWLYRVAHNEAVSLIRKRGVATADAELQMPSQPAADDVFESRERLRTLVADLASLPDRQRSALVMLELSGLSHDQISGALGVSPGAARQLVYEARVALQDLEEGRAMQCESARRAISDGDGRVLRGRRLRSHLKSCSACTDFKSAIETRSGDLGLIAPPITAVAASGVLASVLGGSATAGVGAVGGLFGGLGGGILGAKTLAVIAASTAVGVGLGATGGVDLPGFGSDPGSAPNPVPIQETLDPGTAGAGAPGAARSQQARQAAGQENAPHGQDRSDEHAKGNGKPDPGANTHGQGIGNAHGQASGVPAHANGNAVGQQPGHGNDNPHAQGGNGTPPASPPGQAESKATGPPAQSNAGGVDRPKKAEKADK